MTREEAIDKVLDEIQEDFLNVNLPLMEKMTLFAKTQNAVRYVADLPTVEAVPLSVIEDIKAELHKLWDNEPCVTEHGCDKEVYDLIDRKVKECTHEL